MDNKPDIDIDFTSFDYREYQHEDGDVVYCDPPYQGTKNYGNTTFDHDSFWEWVRTRDYPVYVSEYNAPEGFVSIFKKKKVRLAGGGNSSKNGKALEQVYIHKKFV